MSINTGRLFLEGEAAIPGNSMESLFLELIESHPFYVTEDGSGKAVTDIFA